MGYDPGVSGSHGAVGVGGIGGVGGFGGGVGGPGLTALGDQGSAGGGGGGGLGAGGDIFIQAGGSLVIEGGTLGAATVLGGTGGTAVGSSNSGNGYGLGAAMFLQGNQTQTLQAAAGQTLVVAGSIDDQTGSIPSAGSGGAGTIVIAGGTVDLTAASDYTGGTTIEDGTLILGAAGAAGSGGITFGSGDPPFLEFSLAAAPTNVISGFVSGDTIDVTDLTFASITSTVFDTGTDTLTIDYATGGAGGELNLTFSGAYTAGEFGTVYDGASGTDIVVCYLRGTQILTPLGEAKVETLGIGDRVVTRFGGIQKIKWIGRQSYEAAGAPPHKIPVRIRAGALGDNIPARDLYISPGHSMLLDDTLVLATALLNGITVTQEMPEPTPQIEFHQIELESHDCVIAEGAWSETFADGPGLRDEFHNAAEFFILYPDEPPPVALNLCAPRPESGAKLEAALRPVMARAAESVTPGRLEGYVERASAWKVEGWALDADHPSLPVLLEIRIQNRVIGTALARNHRADLAAAGKGAGCCAFTFSPPERLRPELLQTLRIRRAADGADLPLSSEILAMLPATTPPPRLRAVA
jgi:autotransporter-associated beta strand protein